jgi:hypothetical protein
MIFNLTGFVFISFVLLLFPQNALAQTWSACGPSGIISGSLNCANIASYNDWGSQCSQIGQEEFCKYSDCQMGRKPPCGAVSGGDNLYFYWSCTCFAPTPAPTTCWEISLNGATNKSCNELCSSHGTTCAHIGTYGDASGGNFADGVNGACTKRTGGCDTVMSSYSNASLCSGIDIGDTGSWADSTKKPTMWTNCCCTKESSTPTPTPNCGCSGWTNRGCGKNSCSVGAFSTCPDLSLGIPNITCSSGQMLQIGSCTNPGPNCLRARCVDDSSCGSGGPGPTSSPSTPGPLPSSAPLPNLPAAWAGCKFKLHNSTGIMTNPILWVGVRFVAGVSYITCLIPALLNVATYIGIIIFFIIFLIGGINWITSGGDKVKVEMARSKITHAVIGLIILLSLIFVIIFIQQVFKINITVLNIQPLL